MRVGSKENMRNSTRKKIKQEKQAVETAKEKSRVVVMAEAVPKLMESKEYNMIAAVAAGHGARYLEEELNNGVSEEDANFMPEAFIYKGGKLEHVCWLGDVKSQDDVDKYINRLFRLEPTMVVLVNGMWLSLAAVKNGGRPSQQPDRINAGIGTVYLAPDNIVARMSKPVFTAVGVVQAIA